jgi:GTPase
MAAVAERLPDDEGEADDDPIRVAIVGRPNVGKSSLVNALLGEERVIVADVPGTTRDTIDVRFEYGGRSFVLIDTAGLRRKAEGDVEYYASLRSEEATRRADVAVLVVDPAELRRPRDARGQHRARTRRAGGDGREQVGPGRGRALEPTRKALREALVHLAAVPRIETSALTSFGLHALLAAVVRVYDRLASASPPAC